jgi:hypothetical protein
VRNHAEDREYPGADHAADAYGHRGNQADLASIGL